MQTMGATIASCRSCGALIDSFDDGRDDTSIWHVLSQGAGVSSIEAGGRVVISVAADAVPFDGPGYRALETHYGTQCSFEGDYTISMEYQLLAWPLQNGFQVSLASFFSDDFIWRESRPWGESYFAFADGTFGAVPTMDQAGSFRIVRSNGVVTASYLANGVWVPLLTSTSDGHAVVGFQLARITTSSWVRPSPRHWSTSGSSRAELSLPELVA